MKIALGCEMRVGKDTVANYLFKFFDAKCDTLSFSTPLYLIMFKAQELCGTAYYKDRKFLQLVGTEWARAKDPDVWVKCMDKAVKNNKKKHIIITDVRFKNELKYCEEDDFTTVRVIRDVIPQKEIESNIEGEMWKYITDDILKKLLPFAQEIAGFKIEDDESFYQIFKENYNKEISIGKKHISENQVKDERWNHTIENNGTLEELYEKIDYILSYYFY